MDEQRPWHRLFGLSRMDFFRGQPAPAAGRPRHYRPRSPDTSTLLTQLLDRYQREDLIMPDALDEFTRQTIDELLKKLPARKCIEGLPVEELAAALSPEEREALARLLKTNGAEPSQE